MDILSVVFDALGDIVTGIVAVISDSFSGVVSLWYTAPTGTNTTGELTFLGVFSLIAFVVGLVWLAIRFIGGMISLKSAR
jgi:hypothetical protein